MFSRQFSSTQNFHCFSWVSKCDEEKWKWRVSTCYHRQLHLHPFQNRKAFDFHTFDFGQCYLNYENEMKPGQSTYLLLWANRALIVNTLIRTVVTNSQNGLNTKKNLVMNLIAVIVFCFPCSGALLTLYSMEKTNGFLKQR